MVLRLRLFIIGGKKSTGFVAADSTEEAYEIWEAVVPKDQILWASEIDVDKKGLFYLVKSHENPQIPRGWKR